MTGTYRTIASPDVFDTGVCGGHCIGNLPQETLHSSILHLLLTSTPNEPSRVNDTTNYQKCCAPVEYSAMSMVTIVQKPNHAPVYEIKVFHDLSVKRCACIYSRKYANEQWDFFRSTIKLFISFFIVLGHTSYPTSLSLLQPIILKQFMAISVSVIYLLLCIILLSTHVASSLFVHMKCWVTYVIYSCVYFLKMIIFC